MWKSGNTTLGFQLRFLALVVFAFVPIFLLTIFTFYNLRKAAFEVAEKNLVRLVGIIELTQLQILSGTNELLVALSQLPEISDFDKERCDVLLPKIQGSYDKYVNIGVADLEGNVICSAIEPDAPVNIADRKYFKDVIEMKTFSIGEYQTGRISEKSEINFAYPVQNSNGEIRSVIFASVGLNWVKNYIDTASLPEHSTLMVVDTNGMVLVATPNEGEVGKEAPNSLFEEALAGQEGVIEATVADQIPRLYAFGNLQVGPETSGPDAYIILGIDRGLAFSVADDAFYKSIFVLSVFLIFGLIIATVAGKRLTNQQVGYIKEIEKARKKEAELNEILKLLNKILRHDILNDLTVATGNISIYFQEGGNKEDINGVLKNIKEAMDRGISFIHKMRELEGAISTGKNLEPTDIGEVLASVKKEHTDMVIDVSGEGMVLADDALFSVLDNLIKNAKDHAGVKRVDVMIDKDGKFVNIRVADKGKGIPDEVKEKLFHEGFKYGETGHTGIGLYIVRKTIERYGGKVSIESNDPTGTVFVITLPATLANY